jgi:hypothetical protein
VAAALLVALAMVVATVEVAVGHERARTAAAAAALAAVGTAPLVGGDGAACAAAAAAAEANGAALRACHGPADGWGLRAHVEVVVRVRPGWGILPPLAAEAAAILEPAPRRGPQPGGPPGR